MIRHLYQQAEQDARGGSRVNMPRSLRKYWSHADLLRMILCRTVGQECALLDYNFKERGEERSCVWQWQDDFIRMRTVTPYWLEETTAVGFYAKLGLEFIEHFDPLNIESDALQLLEWEHANHQSCIHLQLRGNWRVRIELQHQGPGVTATGTALTRAICRALIKLARIRLKP